MYEHAATGKQTCMMCNEEIDSHTQVKICSTCIIIAMSEKDFQRAYYIGIIDNQNITMLSDMDMRRIIDLFLPYQEQQIKTVEKGKIRRRSTS